MCTVTLTKILSLSSDDHRIIKEKIVDLLSDSEFLDSITYSTNSSRQARSRFERMERMVSAILEETL